MSRRIYRVALYAAAIGYIAWALFVGFWPSPVDKPVHTQIVRGLVVLHAHGVPRAVNYGFVEFSANIWFFVPAGVLAGALLPVRRWWVAILAGVAFSAAIETGQLLFLPERVASWGDIVANSLGTIVGVAVVVLLRIGAARASHARAESVQGRPRPR